MVSDCESNAGTGRLAGPFLVVRARRRRSARTDKVAGVSMADRLTPERRSANMSRIRSKDTGPELAVRRLLHRLGYRYRIHRKDLPGKPDVVFQARRKIILVHGCFWHGHAACVDGRRPKSRAEYWGPKIAGNIARDARHLTALKEAGWSVMTIWECETKNEDALTERLLKFLGPKKVDAR